MQESEALAPCELVGFLRFKRWAEVIEEQNSVLEGLRQKELQSGPQLRNWRA